MNATAPAHLVDTAPTGIFPSQTLRELIADGAVTAYEYDERGRRIVE